MSDFSFFGGSLIPVLAISIVSSLVSVLIFLIAKEKENKQFFSRYTGMRVHYEREINSLQEKLANTSKKWTDVYQLYLTEAKKNRSQTLSGGYVPDLTNHRFFNALGVNASISSDPNFAFVLTSFHKDFYDKFFAIKEVCFSIGLRCSRGDEEHIEGDLLPHIVRSIIEAQVIICLLDGRNPNVMYELGLAHAFDKYVILVASGVDEANALVDIKSNRVVIFNNLSDLREQLLSALTKLYRKQLLDGRGQ